MLEAAWSLHCPVSHKPTHHHLKVLKGNTLQHDIMLSFIPVGVQMEYIVHSRKWLTAPVRVFDNTCCFMSPHSGRKCRNSLWVSSPRGYEKFTLQARSIGGNRQTAACLITGSILISLFYLPPWIEAEGLTASDYFPRGAPVGSPRCWFWIIYSIIDFLANSQTAFFLSVLLCFLSAFDYRLTLVQ